MRLVQGHSGQLHIDPTLQNNVRIPYRRTDHIYHVGPTFDYASVRATEVSSQVESEFEKDDVQHDPGAQILADVFDARSAEPQYPPNAWLRRSTVLSLGTWPSKSTNSVWLFLKVRGLPCFCTILQRSSLPPRHRLSPRQQR